ncbi:putative peroxisomal membrane protein PXMP2 4 family protein [Lyophyllum shimeji]|uniref:Peroxisomal membrane protein PXMP2 4 family protein n=1 Tax=Lyophyllum shimeji TaxID=47721 RepID=A0A9P3PKQ2_LYOSH|nr:putative peroxisomal membrane protein PXMP2 4 family protein [Lyophyllum shimeji]
MASFIRAYNTFLIRRPYVASCSTAAVLFGAGDIIAQQAIEGKGKEHDFARTGRLTFYGGALFGPCMTKWYQFLNTIKFTTPMRAVVTRVGLDQGALTPVAVAFFFGSMSTLEGKPLEAVERIQAAYVPTIIRNWGVFLPTQIINFALVPHHLRFVVVSVVSLFWNTYLSAVNAQQQKLEAAALRTEVREGKDD